jgi:energy-coupling factor transporter ATP-binding protein EcfA2
MHLLTILDAAWHRIVLGQFRRQHVGFVFQFYNFIPSLTARENVALVSEIAEDPMDPVDALALVGLQDRLDHFPAQMSGGEQQRIAIARAVATRPKVLLCDEPTGALDAKTGVVVLEVIERVNREQGTTTAVITHNAVIADMADRRHGGSRDQLVGWSRRGNQKQYRKASGRRNCVVAMRALDRKLLRNLWEMKGQATAIALVIGCGVAMSVMSLSTLRSLHATRETYYERFRFAEVFASFKRGPLSLQQQLADKNAGSKQDLDTQRVAFAQTGNDHEAARFGS